MRSTISVSVRGLLVALVLLVGITGAYLIGASGDGGPPAQAATNPAGPEVRRARSR